MLENITLRVRGSEFKFMHVLLLHRCYPYYVCLDLSEPDQMTNIGKHFLIKKKTLLVIVYRELCISLFLLE
jgi:hypothetical protein